MHTGRKHRINAQNFIEWFTIGLVLVTFAYLAFHIILLAHRLAFS